LWTEDSSPYVIKNTVTISESARLVIEEGVQVCFDGGCGLVVNGALIAIGSVDKPIVFTSNATIPVKGDWEGIYFGDSSQDDGCILENCIVEYAQVGIRCRDASPKIFDSIVRENLQYGIRCEDSSPILIHNIISENGQTKQGLPAATLATQAGAGISLYGPKTAPVISYNIISNNYGEGIVARYMTAPKTVNFNTIVNNSTHGIYYIDQNQWQEITNNNFYGNSQYDIYNRQSTDVNAPNNYWGLDTTLELTGNPPFAKGGPGGISVNLTKLYDYFDQDRFGRIIYDNWRSEYIDIEGEYGKRKQELADLYRLRNARQIKSYLMSANYSQGSRGYIVYVYSGGDKALIDYNKSDNIENGMIYEVQRDGVNIGKIKVTKIYEKTAEATVINTQQSPLIKGTTPLVPLTTPPDLSGQALPPFIKGDKGGFRGLLQRCDRLTFQPLVVLSDELWLTSIQEKGNWKSYQLPASERRYWESTEILKEAEARPTNEMREFMKNNGAKIIWNHSALGRGKVYFRYNFEVGQKPSEAILKVIAANPCEIYLNEQWVGNAKNNEVAEFNVVTQLVSRVNVIAIMVDRNTGANTPVGLLCELVIR
jgi:hypothetical protein